MSEDLSKLSLTELYDRLEPIPAPPQVSLMPQTVGWVVAGVILVMLAVLCVVFFLRRYRANAYRRVALAALSEAGDDPAAIAQILRRTAIARFPRAQVAGLYGEDWLRFLDATSSVVTFTSTQAGHALLTGPYTSAACVPDLARMARKWVETHSPGAMMR